MSFRILHACFLSLIAYILIVIDSLLNGLAFFLVRFGGINSSYAIAPGPSCFLSYFFGCGDNFNILQK